MVNEPASGCVRPARAVTAVGGWTFATIACGVMTGLYAAMSYRGMYADGSHYLVTIARREWYYFADPSRKFVDLLRQTPTVLLRRHTDLDLTQLAQAFSASMLLMPILIVGLCWPLLPAERKGWIFFPVIQLFSGFSASSFGAIGEGAIGASYFWILLFLLMFRTERLYGRVAFLLLCAPAFYLHEATAVSMAVMAGTCVVMMKSARHSTSRAFLTLALIVCLANVVWNVVRTVNPFSPGDRTWYLWGLLRFDFLIADHRLNLPVVTGAFAIAALLLIAADHLRANEEIRGRATRTIALVFLGYAMAAIICAWSLDVTFIPFAQMQARNHATFVGAFLGIMAVAAVYRPVPVAAWTRTPSLLVILGLCLAQSAYDVAATQRWRSYVADFERRLAAADGLVSFESVMSSVDLAGSRDWRLMSWTWSTPSMSLALSRKRVTSIILNPADPLKWHTYDPGNPESRPLLQGGIGWQPFNAMAPGGLPLIRGVTYSDALLERRFDKASR